MEDSDNFNINEHMIVDYFMKVKTTTLKNNIIQTSSINSLILKCIPHFACSNDTPNTRKNSFNNGSLFKMFTSEVFTIEFIMIYLDTSTQKTIIDTLINLMYQKYIHQSLFYLPQLCVMFNYKNYTESLEMYLLDRCINQLKFSLHVSWLVNSYTEDDDTNGTINKSSYELLLQKIEETLVNGNRSATQRYMLYSHPNVNSEDVYKQSLKKEIRLKYFNACVEFYSKLKVMCEGLKEYEKGVKQKEALYMYINELNVFIKELRKDNRDVLIENNFFYGVVLPFDDSGSTEDNDSTLIVRIIKEESFCFSTKARVPTKLCVECIQMKECVKWEEMYIGAAEKEDKDKDNGNKALIVQDVISSSSSKTNTNMNVLLQHKQNQQTQEKQLREFYEHINKLTLNNEDNSSNSCFNNNVTLTHNEGYCNSNLNLNLSAIREESVSSDSVNNNNNNSNSNSNSNNSNNTSDVILTENLKNIFGKPLSQIATKIKSTSPFKSFKTYHLKSFIAKANDDLRQELLAMQLIKKFNQIFTTANIPLKLHPYEILITSSSSGLLEFLHNTNSIDNIKKHISATNDISLNYFYRNYFKDDFPQAQRNFTESLAAYCLICYYIRIKDRHNGNILIDMHGAVIHIDFGFILGINPGNINFERAPFKLTSDYINIMDGEQSAMYTYFKELMVKGMIESKRHVESIVKCVEIMAKGGGKMPCFENKDIDNVIQRLRERFHERTNDYEFTKIVDDLIYASKDNFWTNKYDKFQQITNGIMP